MDEIDSAIRRLLQEDARLPWRDLGAKVGLSANAAVDRVRPLRRVGIVTGFTAQIDPAAGGRRIEALISVVLLPGTDSDKFATLSSTLGPAVPLRRATSVLRPGRRTGARYQTSLVSSISGRPRA